MTTSLHEGAAACLSRDGLERLAAFRLAYAQWVESTERMCRPMSVGAEKVGR